MAPPGLTRRWQQKLSHEARGLVAARNELVVQAGRTLLGFLPSGRPIWSREFEDLSGLISTMLSIGHSVYIERDSIERIDARTGRTLRCRSLRPGISLRAASGFLTCHADHEGAFHVLEPETLETVATCRDVEGRVSLHDGLFCESTAEHVLVLRDPWTGMEMGRVQIPEGVGHVHHRQCVCLFSATERWAVDIGTGETIWHKEAETDSDKTTVRWPRRRGDLAFLTGRGISAYDLPTGECRWRAQEQEPSLRQWTATEHRLLVESQGVLHLIDPATGAVLGSVDTGLSISSVVAASGGLVAVLGNTETGESVLAGLRVTP